MTHTTFPLVISPSALEELERLQTEENNHTPEQPSGFVRIGVKNGGCVGMSYLLTFEPSPQSHDHTYTVGSVRIVIDPDHLPYLQNMELDFQRGLNARGFVFENPNAKTTCGCGKSFSV